MTNVVMKEAVSPNDSQHYLIDLEVPSLIRAEILSS